MIQKGLLPFLTIAIALFLSACGLGLAPASRASDNTVISLKFGSSDGGSRAVLPGTCFLYFRAWPDAVGVNGALYGPYAVSSAASFKTSDVPGRTYAALDVICSSSALDQATLLSESDLSALADSSAGIASAYRIVNAEIIPNQINTLNVTLVPLVERSGIAVIDSLTYSASIARSFGAPTPFARFFRVEGLPSNVAFGSLSCKVSASEGSVSLALYRDDGSLEPDFSYDAESGSYSLSKPSSAAYYLLAQGEASSYAISVKALPESAGATVTVGFGDPSPKLTGSATVLTSAETLVVTAPTGYGEYIWSLNGHRLDFADNNSVCSLNLATSSYSIVGANTIALRVMKAEGEYLSSTFAFTITE
ncbi:MAG TPA: hypothetical protein PK542_11500 [Treponemataceae bacterium]|nr:hypothetical protein [Treponemataceae bacterium]HPS45100.1 hypothetical protein [Treponemataceae bacterium]